MPVAKQDRRPESIHHEGHEGEDSMDCESGTACAIEGIRRHKQMPSVTGPVCPCQTGRRYRISCDFVPCAPRCIERRVHACFSSRHVPSVEMCLFSQIILEHRRLPHQACPPGRTTPQHVGASVALRDLILRALRVLRGERAFCFARSTRSRAQGD